MVYLYILASVAVFAFNFWAITSSWKHEFGRVTRGQAMVHAMLAAILPAGFAIALIELASDRWPNAWSNFWNKDLL